MIYTNQATSLARDIAVRSVIAIVTLLYNNILIISNISFKNSLVIHEGNTRANQYHDGDFIPDKTY